LAYLKTLDTALLFYYISTMLIVDLTSLIVAVHSIKNSNNPKKELEWLEDSLKQTHAAGLRITSEKEVCA
jgi:hypothetical protein